MTQHRTSERTGTVIVGGGQSGLSVAYQLARRERPFVILDANDRIGDAWRNRWDSLRLFTPARYTRLDGMRFPAPQHIAPTKDEMADYLEAYANHFELPVRRAVRVSKVHKQGARFITETNAGPFDSDNVVVAAGAYQDPWIPPFAKKLDPGIVQIHSRDYRNPSQLQEGSVLLVGAGNSGADIGLEVAREHETWISGRHPGHVPFRIDGPGRSFLHVVRFVGHHLLRIDTPLGRKVIPKLEAGGDPLIRVKPKDMAAAGIVRVPRVVGVRGGLPMLEDERILNVSNVIWCTGFRQNFSWIDLPVFNNDGRPMQHRGVVEQEPGLYFVGLPFQYAASSDVITGVSRDADHIAKDISARASGSDARNRFERQAWGRLTVDGQSQPAATPLSRLY